MRFFIEHSKKPNITVTMTFVYLRFDSKPGSSLAKKFESLVSKPTFSFSKDIEVVPIQTSKQKRVVHTEPRQTILKAAEDMSMILDKLLTA